MKRGIVILIIFTVLIGLCIFEDVYIKTNLKKLNTYSTQLLTLIENEENIDTEKVKIEIENLENFWTTTESYFCIVVHHINLEEVGEQINKIKTLSSQNKKDETIVEVNLLIYYSKSYSHLIIPSIQNIL